MGVDVVEALWRAQSAHAAAGALGAVLFSLREHSDGVDIERRRRAAGQAGARSRALSGRKRASAADRRGRTARGARSDARAQQNAEPDRGDDRSAQSCARRDQSRPAHHHHQGKAQVRIHRRRRTERENAARRRSDGFDALQKSSALARREKRAGSRSHRSRQRAPDGFGSIRRSWPRCHLPRRATSDHPRLAHRNAARFQQSRGERGDLRQKGRHHARPALARNHSRRRGRRRAGHQRPKTSSACSIRSCVASRLAT